MESATKVFGGKAFVYLKFDGDIHALAGKLTKGLMLPEFQIEPSEWPPFNLTGSMEVLGWELWLEEERFENDFRYFLRMETEHSETELYNGDMHDLSPWLARYISEICKVDAVARKNN